MRNHVRGGKGSALAVTLMVMTVLLGYAMAFVSININQNLAAERFKRNARAFYLADAGLDHAVVWLRAQAAPPTGNYVNPWGGVQNTGGGSYTVTITDLGTVGGAGSTTRRYRIVSTGTYQGLSRIATNYVQVDNYARYLWFTDRETFGGTTVWFSSSDHLNGPTHTNAHFNIAGNPVFGGEVRSVDDYIKFYNNGHNINLSQTTNPPYDQPDFQQGVDFAVESTNMPNQALSLRSASALSGLSLTGDTTVVFKSDGTITVTNSKKKWNKKNMALPSNGAIFVNSGTLTMSGVLNGKVTAGASGDVFIPDSITYASDPRTHSDSDDTLGIISESDVVVSASAPDNVEIDACVMALGTSFMVENWSSGSPKGTLTVYGGIIQWERGPVGTFNGSTGAKVTGYSKDYAYDARLQNQPPPFMPTTGDYLTLSWEGH